MKEEALGIAKIEQITTLASLSLSHHAIQRTLGSPTPTYHCRAQKKGIYFPLTAVERQPGSLLTQGWMDDILRANRRKYLC